MCKRVCFFLNTVYVCICNHCKKSMNVCEFRFTCYVLHVFTGSAVSGCVQGLLEDDKYKFHRMPSVDAFNQVLIYFY